MIKIVKCALPHSPASTSYNNIEVQQVVMLLMENIKSLHNQINQLQSAVQELQRR